MPLADIDKVNIELVVHGSIDAMGGDTQKTVTPLHYIRTAAPAPYSAASLITAWQTLVQASWLAAASVVWKFDKITCRVLNSPIEAAVEQVVDLPGDVAGEAYPSFAAIIISKKTPLRGRSYQGRLFFAGIAESAANGNAITAGQLTLMNTLKTKLLTSVNDGSGNIYVPGVLSRNLSNLTADPAVITMTQITTMITRSVMGRQSQRKSKTSA